MGRKKLICNEDCFHCIYADCIMDTLPTERERWRIYYQKHKEEKKAYDRAQYQKRKEEMKNAK